MATTRALLGRADQTTLLALEGEVRYATTRGLRAWVDAVLLSDVGDTIVVDLRSATIVDSTGLGILARIGRTTLERHGRRAVIVCTDADMLTCLRSVAFDTIFALVPELPFEPPEALREIDLSSTDVEGLGRTLLDAHRELASLSDDNQRKFADVIGALEHDVEGRKG